MMRYPGLREAADNPEFFKVFLPYTSSHQISIPEAFIKNFKRVIPKKVILFDHSKKPWHVELKQIDGRLFFKNGWQGFARDHSLEFGDFLVFRYRRNSSFEVKIFSKNGCEKEIAMEGTILSGQGSKAKKACCKQAHVGKKRQLEIGSKKNEEAGCSSKPGLGKSQRTVKTNPEEHKILEDSHFVAPKNPYFVRTISNSSKQLVLLPGSMLRSFNIRLMPNLVIHYQNGNMWSVKVYFRNDGRIFIGDGWLAFINENTVEVGDQCVFEFVLGRENICNELHMQILRGNARVEKPSQHWRWHKKA